MKQHLFTGLWGSSKTYFLRKYLGANDSAVVICENRFDMEKVVNELSFFFPEKRVLPFPELTHDPFDEVKIEKEIFSKRVKTLHSLIMDKSPFILVGTIYSTCKKILSKNEFLDSVLTFSVGDITSIDEIRYFLDCLGYVEVEMVSAEGEFLIRGDLVEIYPSGAENPVRIEFFDDEIEKIYSFDYEKLSKIAEMNTVTILPADEIVSDNDKLIENVADERIKEKIKEFGKFAGIHWYAPYVNEMASIFDYVDGRFKTIVISDSFDEKLDNFEKFIVQNYSEAKHKYPLESVFLAKADLFKEIASSEIFYLKEIDDSGKINVEFTAATSFYSTKSSNIYENAENFTVKLKELIKNNYTVAVTFNNRKIKETFSNFATEHEIIVKEVRNFFDFEAKIVGIVEGSFSGGFIDEKSKFALFVDSEVFGFVKKRRQGKKKQLFKTNIADLEVGDFVVHIDYGIGKYHGIETKEIGGIKGDYIKVEFENEEILYIPISNIGLIQKYVGAKGYQPRLSSLKSNRWKKLKEQAYKSAKKLAVDILKIYAERKKKRGFAFVNDGEILRTIEARFPYEETEDQLVVLNEVFRDMESEKPMERLICGDVGFGKTEVAIRAAAKAVESGKQVAFLAPTTVLVRQHFQNFTERFTDLPVNIDYVSRLKSNSEIKKTLEKVKNGEVDIIIGTHRLLSKDVEFKDLGLLIVDEEQRFGVNHKEKIKAIKSDVDVLTLTATPIPRTLQLSLSGLRDMSVIETPPHDREPVSIKVIKNDEEVQAAILKELKRGGQVYFLHNSVENIEKVAAFVKEMAPMSEVRVAHGQMDSNTLDKVFEEFYQGDIDILVCTTIVENGLDIPNANTIIINNAHKFGLAQLYQLKGRVGRGKRRGYCYLRIPSGVSLSEIARRRLKIIQQLSDLGSGFKISTHDLQLRGAGDILGAEQSGFVVNVGYELYIQMVNDAINELRGEDKAAFETEIISNVPHYIPASFIPSHRERINYYRTISDLNEFDNIKDVIDELNMLYGDLPVETFNLIYIMYLKNVFSIFKVKKMFVLNGSINLVMDKDTNFNINTFLILVKESDKIVANFKDENTLCMVYKGDNYFLKEFALFFKRYLNALKGEKELA
ncbi:transcription-repair coupling factor [Deferribacter autotrophicus]|uniref:Transcription-repair-coupling factor n=1 Tax=Deferribacter autotrophicus TaxID=500465 RepID=A0A5A8F8L5_9BACT|nr:transcription-repair coupling factor [Deferribacter autotrophicus]KAA0258663.1 transcription-repair coupling factor [Deferribacter autotrophicus]